MRTNLCFHTTVMIVVALLHVQALTAQNTAPYWSLAGNSTATTASKLGTTNAIPLRILTANVERIRIDATGKVGIGTTAPSQKLHVVGNAYIVGNNLVTGNLGIGTTAPTQKLHVIGSGLFTTGVTVSSGSVSSTNNYGSAIYGSSPNGYGVYGYSSSSYAMYASSGYIGIYANGNSYGVYGNSSSGYGVNGNSGYVGVSGSGGTYGVYGYSSGGLGVYGNSVNGTGVYGNSTNRKGGYFVSTNEIGIWARTGRTDKNWAGVFEGNVYTFNAFVTSDKNLKKNIEDLGDAIGIINKLKPKSYEFRRDGKLGNMNLPHGRHYGLLAQDLEEVLPNLVMEVENEVSPVSTSLQPPSASLSAPDGKPVAPPALPDESAEKITLKAVNYTELISVVIRGMQELSAKNEALQQQVDDLKQTINKMQQGGVMNASALRGTLAQNHPNPVKGITSIRFSIPQGAGNAQLLVTDNLGRVMKSVQLSASGIEDIDASAFSSGVYNYSLIIDNKTVQTKKMTVVK